MFIIQRVSAASILCLTLNVWRQPAPLARLLLPTAAAMPHMPRTYNIQHIPASQRSTSRCCSTAAGSWAFAQLPHGT
jgi:hypothetical protein